MDSQHKEDGASGSRKEDKEVVELYRHPKLRRRPTLWRPGSEFVPSGRFQPSSDHQLQGLALKSNLNPHAKAFIPKSEKGERDWVEDGPDVGEAIYRPWSVEATESIEPSSGSGLAQPASEDPPLKWSDQMRVPFKSCREVACNTLVTATDFQPNALETLTNTALGPSTSQEPCGRFNANHICGLLHQDNCCLSALLEFSNNRQDTQDLLCSVRVKIREQNEKFSELRQNFLEVQKLLSKAEEKLTCENGKTPKKTSTPCVRQQHAATQTSSPFHKISKVARSTEQPRSLIHKATDSSAQWMHQAEDDKLESVSTNTFTVAKDPHKKPFKTLSVSSIGTRPLTSATYVNDFSSVSLDDLAALYKIEKQPVLITQTTTGKRFKFEPVAMRDASTCTSNTGLSSKLFPPLSAANHTRVRNQPRVANDRRTEVKSTPPDPKVKAPAPKKGFKFLKSLHMSKVNPKECGEPSMASNSKLHGPSKPAACAGDPKPFEKSLRQYEPNINQTVTKPKTSMPKTGSDTETSTGAKKWALQTLLPAELDMRSQYTRNYVKCQKPN